jgi:hypothetical protein
LACFLIKFFSFLPNSIGQFTLSFESTKILLNTVTGPVTINGGIQKPRATPSWFPKTPRDVAVET